MRTESNMTKARRIVEENEIKLGACMLKPERERFIESAAKFIEFMTPARWFDMVYFSIPEQVRDDIRRSKTEKGYYDGLPVERRAEVDGALLQLDRASNVL